MASPAVDSSARHGVFVQRYAVGLTKDFEPVLEALKERIAIHLSSGAPTDEIIKQIQSSMTDIYAKYDEELNKQLIQFANAEQDFTIAQAANMAGAELKPPPTLWADVKSKPLQLIRSGDTPLLEPFIKDWEEAQILRVERAIRSGVMEGLTHTEILKGIVKEGSTLDSLATSNKMMIRTAVNHVSNEARAATYAANPDIVGHEWVAKLDARTTDICRGLDGDVFIYDKDSPILFPPAHIGACAKGTMITTKSGLTAIEDVKVGDYVLTHNNRFKKVTIVMCREHKGKMIDLVFNDDSRISLTHDHPILSRSEGWINAEDANTRTVLFQNDKELVRPEDAFGSEVAQAVLIDSHNIKTEVTEELISYGIFSFTTGMSSSINLNNRIIDNEIYNVLPNSPLKKVSNPNTIKELKNKGFVLGGFIPKIVGKGFRDSFFNSFHVARVALRHSLAACIAALLCPAWVLLSPVIVAARSFNMLLISSNRIQSRSGLYPKFYAPLSNSVIGKAILTLYHSKALAFNPVVIFNKLYKSIISKHKSSKWFSAPIKSIVEYNANTMVYNLAIEEDETYIANNILVHNCRSTTAPIFREGITE